MKKLICVTLCVLFACISLVGCSSAIIPTSTPSWAEGEVLTYNVRKATSYELTTVGIDLDYRQILPSYVTGTYSTKSLPRQKTITCWKRYFPRRKRILYQTLALIRHFLTKSKLSQNPYPTTPFILTETISKLTSR